MVGLNDEFVVSALENFCNFGEIFPENPNRFGRAAMPMWPAAASAATA